MGQLMTSGLTQYDVEELQIYSGGVFSQAEVATLYKRFQTLDKGNKGYISGDEFHNIPELSINPLAQRIVRLYDNVNFRDFVRLLAAFSPKANQDTKIKFYFQVFDVDGDGLVSPEDLEVSLRLLVGGHLSSDEISTLVSNALLQADRAKGMDLADFQRVLAAAPMDIGVNIPLKY